MVDYSRPTMIYLDDDPTKISERFRACFCPSRDLGHTHNVHHGHVANVYLGDKLGKLCTLKSFYVRCVRELCTLRANCEHSGRYGMLWYSYGMVMVLYV